MSREKPVRGAQTLPQLLHLTLYGLVALALGDESLLKLKAGRLHCSLPVVLDDLLVHPALDPRSGLGLVVQGPCPRVTSVSS